MTTQPGPKQLNPLAVTIAYFLFFIIFGFIAAAEGPSLPSLAKNTISSLDRISLIFVFGPLGYLVGSFLSGQAYDRFPGHKLIALSLVIIAASAFLIPVIDSLWLLLLIFFVLGLAKGALDVGGNTLLLWIHGEKVGPFMNGMHFCFGVGAFVSPLILARVLEVTGEITWLFWICSLICLPLAVWIWILPAPSSQAHIAAAKNTTFPVFPVVLVVVLFILYVGLEMGFGNWIYTYALTLGLSNPITAAYLTSAFWFSFTLGRLLAVWISTRMRSQTILFLDLLGCLASAIVIMLWRDSNLALWAGAIGLGIFMASIFPTLLMFAGERMHVTGAITGWFLVGSGAGNILLPWLIGQAFVLTGPQAMPTIILVDTAMCLLVLIYFVTQHVADVIVSPAES
jgi:MFS transporter, FHS family, Na+ dependent glucose transporter 1